MAEICSLDGVTLSDSPVMPANMRALFSGPWAAQEYHANVRLLGEERDEQLPPFSSLFVVRGGGNDLGAVLVDDIDPSNRRARIHVSLFKEARKVGTAYVAMVMVATVLGDCFGIERMWTYVRNGSAGAALATKCGLVFEGQLRGHALNGLGREDVFIFGGLWKDLRAANKYMVERVEWAEPMAVRQ